MGTIRDRALKASGCFLILFVVLFLLTLNQAQAYPAPRFQAAYIFSWHTADGSTRTLFISLISGPSPEDVDSLTATGPSGTFRLEPSRSYKQYGLQYQLLENSLVNNGIYTFTITDKQGRSTSVVRNFTYDATIPQVDSATMSPANWSYVGTTTPTLSFDPVDGGAYYQVTILDYDGKAIWYASSRTTSTSFTVPSGLLQPDTGYYWDVRVCDSDTDPQNYHLSNRFYFYTGTKTTPVLNSVYVVGWPYYNDTRRSVLVGKVANVAPWDIDYFRATGPDTTVYELNIHMNSFQDPAYYIGVVDKPSGQSIPSGNYAFEIKDKLSRTDSDSYSFSYDPLPDFSGGTFYPADNAYLDTNRPTFTWPRISVDHGNGTYLYFIRITGYTASDTMGIIWYQSEGSAEVSFTIPADLNLPLGSSYEWQWAVMGTAGNHENNWGFSDYHTFTINGPACYVNKDDSTCGGKSPCYTSIQSAIDAADTGYDIRIAQGTYTEEINLNQSKSLRLQGGWDTSFENQTGTTILRQAPKAPQGSLTLQELKIEPE